MRTGIGEGLRRASVKAGWPGAPGMRPPPSPGESPICAANGSMPASCPPSQAVSKQGSVEIAKDFFTLSRLLALQAKQGGFR